MLCVVCFVWVFGVWFFVGGVICVCDGWFVVVRCVCYILSFLVMCVSLCNFDNCCEYWWCCDGMVIVVFVCLGGIYEFCVVFLLVDGVFGVRDFVGSCDDVWVCDFVVGGVV